MGNFFLNLNFSGGHFEIQNGNPINYVNGKTGTHFFLDQWNF